MTTENCDEFVFSEAAKKYFPDSDFANAPVVELTAFVSCYNEGHIIQKTLNEVSGALIDCDLSFEIIVIDDGSNDNSREEINHFVTEHSDLNIIVRYNIKNRGLAQNYVDSAFLGSGRFHKLFCGDNTEPRDSISRLLSHLGEADILIPFYTSVEGKAISRKILSRSYTLIINLISGHRIKYYNGLQVHLRNNILRWHPNTTGFGFQADILCMLLDHNFSFKHVGISAQEVSASRALSIRNFLSVGHVIIDLIIRRISKKVYY